jgi:excisionase family DNA binding protein
MPLQEKAKLSLEPIAVPSLISSNEASARLGVCTRTLYRMKDRRQISYVKLNGVLRFERADVEALIERRKVRAA